MNDQFAELKIDGKIYKLKVLEGTENEKAIDIRTLRKDSGYVTLDPAYVNTASCTSEITYIDGEKGILRYRGIPIEELTNKTKFIETAYLLINGSLPNDEQKKTFSRELSHAALLHEDVRQFLDSFPSGAHPMQILSTVVNALSTFYPNIDFLSSEEDIEATSFHLISIVRTIAAFAYKKSIGEPVVYPKDNLSYCANFLHMMFDSPVKPYVIDEEIVAILNKLFILHADHEQNCSTSVVRVIGSAQANLYTTIAGGINTLSGPLHGGATQFVIDMLKQIYNSGDSTQKYIDMAKDKNNPFRLFGFGHRVYKNYDPRARIIKESCRNLLNKLDISDPLLKIAMELEDKVMKDEYFISRKLYPNVDFYSGLIYKAIGIPENMFTVMFALGRLPGWITQWREMVVDKDRKIARPRQIYVGNTLTHL